MKTITHRLKWRRLKRKRVESETSSGKTDEDMPFGIEMWILFSHRIDHIFSLPDVRFASVSCAACSAQICLSLCGALRLLTVGDISAAHLGAC